MNAKAMLRGEPQVSMMESVRMNEKETLSSNECMSRREREENNELLIAKEVIISQRDTGK